MGNGINFMLIELETRFETGLGVLINQVILFLLRQQKAPGQLREPRLSNLDRIRTGFWFLTYFDTIERG